MQSTPGRSLQPSLSADVDSATDALTRPTPIAANYDHIPGELCERRQWVIWRHEHRDGRWTKVPHQATSPQRRASATDPSTWSSFEQAVRSTLR